MELVQPKRPNSCRLSVAANVINYYSDRPVVTPEEVLGFIDDSRVLQGLQPTDLAGDPVSDEEIDTFLKDHSGGISRHELRGKKFLDWGLLNGLISSGFVLSANHLLLYSDPSAHALNSFSYLPADLLSRLIEDNNFTYQTFVEFQQFAAGLTGDLENGHLDIILDLIEIEGVRYIVLANLASYGNDYPVAIPWDFYRHYLAFDWGGDLPIGISKLPDELTLSRLMENGYLERDGLEYFYGCLEIYYPADRKDELDRIIVQYEASMS